jgi:hypothetical protein
MGCDIHMFIEYSPYEGQGGRSWRSMGGRYNPGRDYDMFEVMAGVRGDAAVFEPRGVPEGHLSWEAADYLKEDTDLHSHSWLTGDEYCRAYGERLMRSTYGPPDIGYEMIMVVMQAFKERGVPARVVFAFDN